MSYKEFAEVLGLEGCVMASTRVDAKDCACDDLFGCVYKVFPQVLAGRTVTLKKGSCSCGGFEHNAGLVDERPKIPGGFGVFLAQGSDQMWTPKGERFKCDPQTGEAMFDSLPKDVMDGHDAIRFEPYREGLGADVVTVFCTPDQLSALINLHGYNRGYYDHVIATTASGCASMLRVPFSEIGKDHARAVITGTDIATRKFMDENKVAISFTGDDFDAMLRVTGECFFHAEVFKKTKERIHHGEGKGAVFTRLA